MHSSVKYIFICCILSFLPGAVEAAQVSSDLGALRAEAEKVAAEESKPQEGEKPSSFKLLGLGLQELNPEISVTGDLMYAYSVGQDVNQNSDFTFRGLGLHFESYLDPYSRFKSAFSIGETGVPGIGEAYLTRYGVLGGNLTIGKFRQQFGVINRWHKHGLDQLDFPLPLRQVFGDGGLNQVGISQEWNWSWLGMSQQFIFQATDGGNARLFGGNTDNRPSLLGRIRGYRDLSSSTYLELGITGLVGWNNRFEVGTAGAYSSNVLRTMVYGADFTVLWEPPNRMRYFNIEWRTEAYYVDRRILAADGSGEDTLHPWGFYSSLQAKVSRTLEVGVRADYFRPAIKSYASTGGISLSPLAVSLAGSHQWLLVVYTTWYQSPFVKFRVEFDHQLSKGMGATANTIWLQCVFAAGPHKHERY